MPIRRIKNKRPAAPKKAAARKRSPAAQRTTKRRTAAQASALPTPEQIAATIAEAQRQVMAATAEATRMDPGTLNFLSAFDKSGVHIVHAAIAKRNGSPIFSTAGTRWNLHGVEQFENGTTLYLHHLDHPTTEKRIIVWPPDNGTFESFAESMPLAALRKELEKRDAAMAKKPAPTFAPPESFFRESKFVARKFYIPPPGRDGTRPPFDPERFKIDVQPSEVAGRLVAELVIADKKLKELVFDLVGSGWDAQVEIAWPLVNLILRPPSDAKKTLKFAIDLENFVVLVPGVDGTLPIDWVERHIRNFALYEEWAIFIAALKSGPQPPGSPDITLSAPDGWSVELWPGDQRRAAPYMHPRIVDKSGLAIFDARASQWAAIVKIDAKRPIVTLHFISSDIAEREDRFAGAAHPVTLDLTTRRVTVDGMKGESTIGRLHEMIQRVRGVTWLVEELTEMTGRGKLLPRVGKGR